MSESALVLIYGSIGMMIMVTSVVVFIYLFQRKLIKKQLAHQEVEILLKQQEIKTTYALLEGQDKELNRIAKELHDNISTTMVSLNMFLDSFQPKSLGKEEKEILEKINHIAAKTTEDTRKLSHSLDSGSLTHFGLKVAIGDLVEAVSTAGIKMEFYEELSSPLATEMSLNIYRIIQELINNTLKHAQASKINLEVSEIKGEFLNIIYEDNGIGFDPETESEGIGLRNIQSRIATIKGTLTIDTNKNTTFIIEAPIDRGLPPLA